MYNVASNEGQIKAARDRNKQEQGVTGKQERQYVSE